MTRSTPAAFNHSTSEAALARITSGVTEVDDAVEAVDKVLANIAVMIRALIKASEAAGHSPEVVMDGLDNIVDVLEHRSHMITAAIVRNTEWDVED